MTLPVLAWHCMELCDSAAFTCIQLRKPLASHAKFLSQPPTPVGGACLLPRLARHAALLTARHRICQQTVRAPPLKKEHLLLSEFTVHVKARKHSTEQGEAEGGGLREGLTGLEGGLKGGT